MARRGGLSTSPGPFGPAGLRNRQPLARLWLALPGGDLHELDALVSAHRRGGQRQGGRAHRR